jgi:hypothetical protein
MQDVWKVPLPKDAHEPFEVYVNGVLQRRGIDYAVQGRMLVFVKPLAQEGKLGFWRWLWMALGVAGTYRKHDSVDVVYTVGDRRTVATGLPIIPPEPPDAA